MGALGFWKPSRPGPLPHRIREEMGVGCRAKSGLRALQEESLARPGWVGMGVLVVMGDFVCG